MEQIISDFQADGVDLMVGVATPVAMRMQASTEGTDTPVVFSAVSDPVGAGLVESWRHLAQTLPEQAIIWIPLPL